MPRKNPLPVRSANTLRAADGGERRLDRPAELLAEAVTPKAAGEVTLNDGREGDGDAGAVHLTASAEAMAVRRSDPRRRMRDATLRQALASGAFWVFALGAALYGLIASGIGLFNESILVERGFDANVNYQALVVTAMTALAGNFGGGWLATRVRLGQLLAGSLFVLAAGLAALPHVTTLAQVMAWAAAMGLGGGVMTVLFFSVWPRVFGREHLGQIQGAAQALTVLASALGPLLLA